jgi:hypothetical protein
MVSEDKEVEVGRWGGLPPLESAGYLCDVDASGSWNRRAPQNVNFGLSPPSHLDSTRVPGEDVDPPTRRVGVLADLIP